MRSAIDLEKILTKFQNETRKQTYWKTLSDDKFRVSKPKDDNIRNVVIGSKSWGCEIDFKIEDDIVFVSKFNPVSGGIITRFCPFRAEKGLQYLLNLSAAVDAKMLIIKKTFYEESYKKPFKQQGFSFSNSNISKTVLFDFHNGEYHRLRKKYVALLECLNSIKEKDPAFKWEWIGYENLAFKFSFYTQGIKGFFYLKADNGQIYLSDDVVKTKLEVVPTSNFEETLKEAELFFKNMQEKRQLKVLLKCSDEIFNDINVKKLKIKKKYTSKVFTYLSESYEQEELDRRLIENDFDFFVEFGHSTTELSLFRILDIYLIIDQSVEDVSFFKDATKAKTTFSNKCISKYTEIINKQIEIFH